MQGRGLLNHKTMLIDFRKLFPRYNIKPTGVLHLGANRGEEAPVYDELGIKKVYWIEANPEIIPQLSAALLPYYPGQEWFNYCIGDEHDKPVKFHVSNNGSQSSSVLELGTHLQQHPEVHYTHDIEMHTKRIDMLFQDNFPKDIDFLNLDLQGFEGNALRGMGDLLHQFKWIYTEVNRDYVYKNCMLIEDIEFLLAPFGFRKVETKWVGNWGDCLLIKS